MELGTTQNVKKNPLKTEIKNKETFKSKNNSDWSGIKIEQVAWATPDQIGRKKTTLVTKKPDRSFLTKQTHQIDKENTKNNNGGTG